jgi:(1->4)-alpha-D-glucan 1-alpha-D-glucosylmutase
MIPQATYRLQFHAGFTFADAEAIIPYLASLGISHVYASPITAAAKGSMHGYDVIDPTRVNPELGGEAGLVRFVDALKAAALGLIIDIVPNHMGVAGDANGWWMDVLEKGQASSYAPVFDIDWRERIALPILGSPLDEAIADGAIRLVEREGRKRLQLYEGAIYPLRSDDPAHGEERTDLDAPALAALVERQHYRLLYWRAANDGLNWRRFFSINELAGVRVEDPAVFELTHRLYFDLFARGLIDGVRIDHVDGLSDPAGYCRRLRTRFEAIAPERPAYVIVEKILAADEPLATDWAIDGTSGYDFMREASELLHEPTGLAPMGRLWAEISGRSPFFAPEAVDARREMLAWQFEGQLAASIAAFHALAQAEGRNWITKGMLRRAIERLLWVFPVYRTYGDGSSAPVGDMAVRDAARRAALPLMPPGEAPILDLVLGWLAGSGRTQPALAAEAVRRFQQLSAPIAAKGVEDTAFYRHGALLSANDVGFEPVRFGSSIAAFHHAMSDRAAHHPHAMLTTATHDHKRGEDARARLAVLSAVPELWQAHVRRWLEIAARFGADIDAADQYIFFQALVGAWDGQPDIVERMLTWQRKAVREAKLRSAWEAPDEHYEGRCLDWIETLLTGEGGEAFRKDFRAFMAMIEAPALANSLAQTALRYLVPGVPDLYQGCELPDVSMVDPDNRRPVDFALRQALLAGDSDVPVPKLRLIADLLALRRRNAVIRNGAYRPLVVSGLRADNVVAFERFNGEERLLCAVAIRLAPSLVGHDRPMIDPSWWQDTVIGRGAAAVSAQHLFAEGIVTVRGEN